MKLKKQAIIAATTAAILSVSLVGCAADNASESKQLVAYTDEKGITYVGNEFPNSFTTDNMVAAYCECGTCGAHVTEWHWVQNYDQNALVPVCDYCYEIALEEDKANER